MLRDHKNCCVDLKHNLVYSTLVVLISALGIFPCNPLFYVYLKQKLITVLERCAYFETKCMCKNIIPLCILLNLYRICLCFL